MGRLKGLVLNEFSIVRGSDVQPANPEAVALVYKSTPKQKEQPMKETQKAGKTQTLKARLVNAVNEVLKGQQVRTVNSSSNYTETVTDDTPAGGEPDGEGVTVIVASTAATETPVEKTEPTTAAPAESDPIPGITDVLKSVLSPVTAGMQSLGDRLAKLERAPAPSQAIGKFQSSGMRVSDNNPSKFPEFTKYLRDVSNLSPGQKLTKTTLTSSGWSYGLGFAEAGAFIDYIVDQSVLLKQCRTVKMPNQTYNLDKIGLGGKVLKKGTPGTDPGDTVSLSGPTQVRLSAQEVIAIVSIGDDTLEDNIEGDAFVQHLLGMVGRASANELEEAAIHADSAVSDTGILDRFDGWYKLAKANGAHVIEAMADSDRYWPGTAPVGSKMTRILKAIPSKYRQDPAMLRCILNTDLMLDYLDSVATIAVPNAFLAVTGIQDVPIRLVPNVKVPYLSTTQSFTYSSTPYTDGTFVMVTDVRNLIFGIHREIKIEPYRQPRKRCTDYVLSMRCDAKIENGDAIGIYDHAKVHA